MSGFTLRLMEHRDAPLVARLLSTYLSISKYANRALSAEKLPMTIFNVIELDQNLGLVVDDESGIGRVHFLVDCFLTHCLMEMTP